MKALISALALTTAVLSAVPANAALTNYAFAGALADGTKFDGAFTVDDTKSSLPQFSNYYANVAGAKLDKISSLSTDTSSYYIIGFTDNKNSFNLGLNAKSNSSLKLYALGLGALNSMYTSAYTAGKYVGGSGTISLATAAAVPEPATWALMILGFGAVGYSMRRKNAVARFA